MSSPVSGGRHVLAQPVLDGSVALQANASYQMNYAGQNGANAVSLLSRARIKF